MVFGALFGLGKETKKVDAPKKEEKNKNEAVDVKNDADGAGSAGKSHNPAAKTSKDVVDESNGCKAEDTTKTGYHNLKEDSKPEEWKGLKGDYHHEADGRGEVLVIDGRPTGAGRCW